VPANLHFTLRFLGSVERSLADGVAGGLEGQAGSPFEVALGGQGTFTSERRIRVVWLGVRSGDESMRALAARVEAQCLRAGLPPEPRTYRPHLTLARARAREGAALPELPPPPLLDPWRVEELVLYSSHLARSGAVHEALRTIPLDG
jgi:RNA 2',3'-cyclic 3'-phosphodiesterase